MSVVTIDPQAVGWRDDGSESGVLRSEMVKAGAVPQPFRYGAFATMLSGASASYQTALVNNLYGFGSGVYFQVAAGSNGAELILPFSGVLFGLGYLAQSTAPVVSVDVDGVGVAFDASEIHRRITTLTTTVGEYPEIRITHTDLDPGPHIARIAIVAPPAGTTTLTLHAYFVSALAGYPSPNRMANISAGVAVPVSYGTVPSGGGNVQLDGIQRLWYSNTTGAGLTVTVRTYGASSALASFSVPANGQYQLDFGSPLSNARTLEHMASGAGAVCYAIGV